MDLDWLEDRELDEWITQSLRSIREAADAGIDEDEAIRRATEIEQLILAGRISPAEVDLNHELKDVLYALVYRVLDVSGRAQDEATRRGTAVREFIRGLRWENDESGERDALLKDCAEAGAGHRHGEGLETVARRVPERTDRDSSEDSRSSLEFDGTEDSAEARARRAFNRVFPLIHAVLVELHQLTEPEARHLETELLVWFVRFCRRSSSLPGNPRALLFAAGSQFARQYRRFGEGSLESSAEARLERLLRRAFSELSREPVPGEEKGP